MNKKVSELLREIKHDTEDIKRALKQIAEKLNIKIKTEPELLHPDDNHGTGSIPTDKNFIQ